MVQVKSILLMNVGGERVSFTYDVLDDNGNATETNIKENFYAVDSDLKSHIEAIRTYVENRKSESAE